MYVYIYICHSTMLWFSKYLRFVHMAAKAIGEV